MQEVEEVFNLPIFVFINVSMLDAENLSIYKAQ